MRKMLPYMMGILVLASCQHQLHFPAVPAVVIPHEKIITAIVVTDPTQTDYDSLVFRYEANRTREVHFSQQGDSVTRTYSYDAAGRLSTVEDEKAIYYTNNNRALRISFFYDAGGQLLQTKTDFTDVQGVTAFMVYARDGNNKRLTMYDTAYTGTSYNLDWNNRLIYSSIDNSNYIVYDSGVYINTAGLVKTIVNVYSYGADSSVASISKRIYFNQELSEYGTVLATGDRSAPVYKALRKKLYRNLSNWFEQGLVWQDDNYHLFPLPGGAYKSILYQGFSISAGPASPPYTRDYDFTNSYAGDQLNKSIVDYSLQGQGNSKYTNVLRFYYKD